MGTRGGRPEPQAVTARTAGKNAQRSKQGNRKPGTGRPGSGQSGTAAAAQSAKNPAAKSTAAKNTAAKLEQQPGPGRWFQWTTLVLSLAGLGVSTYLTIAHYTESALAACPESSTINCAKVTTSPESIVFGIFPVAVLGLAFYLFMVAVSNPWAWRARPSAVRRAGLPGSAMRFVLAAIPWARLVSVVVGICFVLYLIYVELFVVNAICLWCTSVHVLTFLLFAFTVFSAATWGLSRPAAGRE
jgi:uncharacterized membrane protein